MEVREFSVYVKAQGKRLKREHKEKRQLHAELQATIVNWSMNRPKKQVSYKDFMPKEKRMLSVNQLDKQLDNMALIFGKKGGQT